MKCRSWTESCRVRPKSAGTCATSCRVAGESRAIRSERDDRRDVGLGWNLGSNRVLGRDEFPGRSVVLDEILHRSGLHLWRLDRLDPVAPNEKQTPVTERGRFGEIDADAVAVGHRDFDLREFRGTGAFHLFVSHRVCREALDHFFEPFECGIGVLPFLQSRHDQELTALGHAEGKDRHRRGKISFDERLVQPSRGAGTQNLPQNCCSRRVRVRAGRSVVERADRGLRPLTPDFDRSRAVLDRLIRPRIDDGLGWIRNRREVLVDEFERCLGLELAGDNEHRILRPVVVLVKRTQVVRGHALDIRAIADRGISIRMPVVRLREEFLHQDSERVVLAHLEFVTDDRHFLRQRFRGDEGVDHPIGFHLEREVEVLIARDHGLVVVRSVRPRRTIEAGAVVLQALPRIRVIRRSLEHHVLEQVGHPLFAAAFLSRPYEVGDVHRDIRGTLIREEQDTQAVRKAILGDTLHGREGMAHPFAGLGRGFGGDRRRKQNQTGSNDGLKQRFDARSHKSSEW